MKKNLLFLFAILMASVVSANAAEAIVMDACNNVLYPTKVSSKDLSVQVDFGRPVNMPNVTVLGGTFRNPVVANWSATGEIEGLALNVVPVKNGEGYTTSCTISVTEDMWGDLNSGQWSIVIGFPDCTDPATLDEDGLPMEALFKAYDEDGTFLTDFEAPAEICFYIPDTTASEYLGYYPTEEDMKEEGLTIADVYDMGIVTFYFSGLVDWENAEAIVTITYKDGTDTSEFFFGEEMGGDMNRSGVMELYVPIWVELDQETSDISSIDISISGLMNADGSDMNDIEVSIFDDNTKSPKKIGTASVNSISTEDAISTRIYAIDGRVIKTGITDLKKGIYIINGRKFVVR